MANKIEVSVPVNVLANVAFWIDRETWQGMAEAERDKLIESKLDEMNATLQWSAEHAQQPGRECPVFIGEVDRDKQGEVDIYDPDEG